ncbi:MAG TPA: acyltransferase [Hellea balneolensis]|uniref:Acyltransferase n=1 Tax=Hellea balneolensis TaxID=287478 RepID=A0A7C5R7L5_9PROT|nr:acyltransferase [Hellea balneolensis]
MNVVNTIRQGLQTPKPTDRLPWLPIVRMIVVAFIAFGYASTMPRGPGEPEYLRVFGYDPSWYGITLLFMISGFLAAKSLNRHNSPLKFLISRAARNLPILALFAASVIFILFPLFGVDSGQHTQQHLKYFIKVVSCFDPNTATPGLLDNALYMCIIQGGLWTFRWGAIAYIGTALIWKTGLLKSPRNLLMLTATMVMVYSALITYNIVHPTPWLEWPVTGLHLGWPFVAGMCAYAYRDHLSRSLIVPFSFIMAAGVHYIFLPWTPYIEILMDLALGFLVFQAIFTHANLPEWTKKIPDLSLGLYVFNWPVSQILLLLLPTLSPLALFGLSFPVAIVLALATWLILNRPIERSLKRYTA